MTEEKLYEALVAQGYGGDEVIRDVARLKLQLRDSQVDRQRLAELEAREQKYQELNAQHEDSLVSSYRKFHEANDLAWTPEVETAIRHMANVEPQHFQTIMVNSVTPGEQKSVTVKAELEALRQIHFGNKTASDTGSKSFSAIEFVRQNDDLAASSHRTGSKASGMFTNSFRAQAAGKTQSFNVPVFRDEKIDKPRMRSSEEIFASIGI